MPAVCPCSGSVPGGDTKPTRSAPTVQCFKGKKPGEVLSFPFPSVIPTDFLNTYQDTASASSLSLSVLIIHGTQGGANSAGDLTRTAWNRSMTFFLQDPVVNLRPPNSEAKCVAAVSLDSF